MQQRSISPAPQRPHRLQKSWSNSHGRISLSNPDITHTHRVSLRSHVCLCTRVFHVQISHHWVVEYLPHVRMKTTDVVIGGGDQTAELIPVGYKHEDALQEETFCDDKRLTVCFHLLILFL